MRGQGQLFLFSILMSLSLGLKAQSQKYTGLFFDKQSQQYFINDKASFTIKPIDDSKYLEKIEYSLDNRPYSTYGGKISFDKEGFHIIRFKAVDPVLNWSPIQSFRIYVDLSSPSTHMSWKGKNHASNGKMFVGPKSTLELTAYDNLSGISEIRWRTQENAKTYRYTGPKSFKKAGEHLIQVSSFDNVGNSEKWHSLSFFVDTLAPSSKASVQGNSFSKGNKLFIDKGSFIALSAEDKESGIAKIEYQLNKGPIKEYHQKVAVENQTTSLRYRSVDNVGNYEGWKEVTVFLDSTPPSLTVKNMGSHQKIAGRIYARPGFKILAQSVDKDSGSNSIIVDNSNPEKISKKEFKFDKEGQFSFSVRSDDKVGNTSNTVSYQIVIDNKAPSSQLKTSQPLTKRENFFMSSLPNRVEFTAQDQGVGLDYIEASYDKKNFFRVEKAIDLATWKVAKKTIFYRSVDQLGNKEPLKEMAIHVRNRGPKVGLFVESSNLPQVPLSQIKNKTISSKKKVEKKRKPASIKKRYKKSSKKKYRRKTKKRSKQKKR